MNNLSGPGSTDRKKRFCFSSWPFGWHSLSVRFRDLSYAWWYVLQRCSYHMHIRSLTDVRLHVVAWPPPSDDPANWVWMYQVLYPSSLITSLEVEERCWLVVWRSSQDNFHFIWSFHASSTIVTNPKWLHFLTRPWCPFRRSCISTPSFYPDFTGGKKGRYHFII